MSTVPCRRPGLRLHTFFDHDTGEFVAVVSGSNQPHRVSRFTDAAAFLAHLHALGAQYAFETRQLTGPPHGASFVVRLTPRWDWTCKAGPVGPAA